MQCNEIAVMRVRPTMPPSIPTCSKAYGSPRMPEPTKQATELTKVRLLLEALSPATSLRSSVDFFLEFFLERRPKGDSTSSSSPERLPPVGVVSVDDLTSVVPAIMS